MSNIFISYSRQNEDIAIALAKDIEALGHNAWFDRDLTGGQTWWDQILATIRKYDVFVFLLSKEALNSTACKREFSYADDLGKTILPVLVAEGLSTNLLPTALSKVQFVDYRKQDRGAALCLAKALATVPHPPLPDPLPTPPEVPISYLGSLAELIDSASILDYEKQIAIVADLRKSIRVPETADDSRILLELLRGRRDLLAVVSDEIDELLTSIKEKFEEPPRPLSKGTRRVNEDERWVKKQEKEQKSSSGIEKNNLQRNLTGLVLLVVLGCTGFWWYSIKPPENFDVSQAEHLESDLMTGNENYYITENKTSVQDGIDLALFELLPENSKDTARHRDLLYATQAGALAEQNQQARAKKLALQISNTEIRSMTLAVIAAAYLSQNQSEQALRITRHVSTPVIKAGILSAIAEDYQTGSLSNLLSPADKLMMYVVYSFFDDGDLATSLALLDGFKNEYLRSISYISLIMLNDEKQNDILTLLSKRADDSNSYIKAIAGAALKHDISASVPLSITVFKEISQLKRSEFRNTLLNALYFQISRVDKEILDSFNKTTDEADGDFISLFKESKGSDSEQLSNPSIRDILLIHPIGAKITEAQSEFAYKKLQKFSYPITKEFFQLLSIGFLNDGMNINQLTSFLNNAQNNAVSSTASELFHILEESLKNKDFNDSEIIPYINTYLGKIHDPDLRDLATTAAFLAFSGSFLTGEYKLDDPQSLLKHLKNPLLLEFLNTITKFQNNQNIEFGEQSDLLYFLSLNQDSKFNEITPNDPFLKLLSLLLNKQWTEAQQAIETLPKTLRDQGLLLLSLQQRDFVNEASALKTAAKIIDPVTRAYALINIGKDGLYQAREIEKNLKSPVDHARVQLMLLQENWQALCEDLGDGTKFGYCNHKPTDLEIVNNLNLKMFGKMSAEYISDWSSSRQKTVRYIKHPYSRYGIKGSKEADSGYQYGFLTQTESKETDCSRTQKSVERGNSGMTISSGFGTFLLGTWDLPGDTLSYKTDMIGKSYLNPCHFLPFSYNDETILAYITPIYNGDSISMILPLSESPMQRNWNFLYNNGPLLLGMSNHIKKQSNNNFMSHSTLGGTYDIGDFKVIAKQDWFTPVDSLGDNVMASTDIINFRQQMKTYGLKFGFGKISVLLQIKSFFDKETEKTKKVTNIHIENSFSNRTKVRMGLVHVLQNNQGQEPVNKTRTSIMFNHRYF